MFTGISEFDNKEARKSFPDTGPMDRWPFIFYDYRAHGYATLFSEDDAGIAAFNFRLNGFQDPPTDHYGRPFWLASSHATKDHCIRRQALHELQLNYTQSLYTSYPNKPKFSFALSSELTHGSMGTVDHLQMVEDDLLRFLKEMKALGHLGNTMAIIFADHGARYANLRETMQGKMEERLPFFSITLPAWFREKHSEMFLNLKRNSQLLTSPFDTYATLAHVLSHPKIPSDRKTGHSLFTRINELRTCAEAGVERHWCPCLAPREISLSDPVVHQIAQKVVEYINNITSTTPLFLRLCERLSLKEVTFAGILLGNQDVERFAGSKDMHGREPRFDDKLSFKDIETSVSYEVHLRTSPNDANYEATASFDGGNFWINGDLSRIDRYGDQPKCVIDKYVHLSKFCFCKNAT